MIDTIQLETFFLLIFWVTNSLNNLLPHAYILYITKNWSVAFNVVTLTLRHFSGYVIYIILFFFVQQFLNSFYKFWNHNKSI